MRRREILFWFHRLFVPSLIIHGSVKKGSELFLDYPITYKKPSARGFFFFLSPVLQRFGSLEKWGTGRSWSQVAEKDWQVRWENTENVSRFLQLFSNLRCDNRKVGRERKKTKPLRCYCLETTVMKATAECKRLNIPWQRKQEKKIHTATLPALCYRNSWIITISQLQTSAGSNTSPNLKTEGNPSGSISFETGRSFFTATAKDKELIGIKGCLSPFSMKYWFFLFALL